MEKERLAGTLSSHNRPLENFLTEAGFDGATVQKSTRWGNRLEADARRWLAAGGFATSNRWINKSDANRMFAMAFGQVRK